MKLDKRRKAILFILSFAFANVALYSIVNFHQNRIFEKELVQFDEYYIKKDENYIKAFISKKVVDNHYGDAGFPILDNILTDVYCNSNFSLVYPFIDDDIQSGISLSIAPTRGSPIA